MSHLDYNIRMTSVPRMGESNYDNEEYTLYQRGLVVGRTTWSYVKEFRDYYGLIEARDVVETWKRENLISHLEV